MIELITFTNFKALRQASVPLCPFTLLLGPNGSGKTSVLAALSAVSTLARGQNTSIWPTFANVTVSDSKAIEVNLRIRIRDEVFFAVAAWSQNEPNGKIELRQSNGRSIPAHQANALPVMDWLGRVQYFALDPLAIANPVPVTSSPLQWSGAGLSAVLDDLKDSHPERWSALLTEMREWLPEYDHILFDKPAQGQKAIALRTKSGSHRIPARDLSQGTLVALALLTLAYLPEPPSVLGLEEIDRGLHPRLLRHLQDALYRLSYPESCGETRPSVQVIATTHSPYLLDLYRDHPEEIVLAQKKGLEVEMKRLSDVDHFQDILGDAPLSEVWYSGVLGGVSVTP